MMVVVIFSAPCEWEYGPFGECSAPCGGGIKRRFPEVVTPAMNGGSCNLPEPEEMTCNTQSCPGKHNALFGDLFLRISL